MDQWVFGGDTGQRGVGDHRRAAAGVVAGEREGHGALQSDQVLRGGGGDRRRRDRPPPDVDQGGRHPEQPGAELPPREHVLANLASRTQEEAGPWLLLLLLLLSVSFDMLWFRTLYSQKVKFNALLCLICEYKDGIFFFLCMFDIWCLFLMLRLRNIWYKERRKMKRVMKVLELESWF